VPTADDLKEVRYALGDRGAPPETFEYHFVDLQGQADLSREPPGRGESTLSWIRAIDTTTTIIRPPRSIRKNDLVYQLSSMARTSSVPVSTLVFADLPMSVAIDVGHLLHEEKLWQLWPNSTLLVYILSQDWSCAAFRLRLDRETFEPDLDAAREFLHDEGKVKNAAALVASVLRERDSQLFWQEIDDGYVNEPVGWPSGSPGDRSSDNEITGYLDIPIALAKENCYRPARRAMRRAIFSFARSDTLTADEMIGALVDGSFGVYNGNRSLGERRVPLPAVLVSSVLVTGSTVSRFSRRTDFALAGTVHLIAHAQATKEVSRGNEVIALRWIPPDIRPRQPRKRYERIPGTSHIIRGGDLAVPLPRFGPPRPGTSSLGDSLYGDDPNTAYGLWQRRGLLRFGHWIYGLHHELLTISLVDAVQSDFTYEKHIVGWVVAALKNFMREAATNDVPWMLLYPRHEVTDQLMRRVSAELKAVQSRSFPLQLIRTSSVSPIIVSPVERERIGIHIGKHFRDGGMVVLLDDGIVTGKTLREMTELVEGLWELHSSNGTLKKSSPLLIRTAALLDRTGIPSQRSLVRKFVRDNPRLWRWDVPSLGHEASCALCAILQRYRDLRSHIPNAGLVERINQWLSTWDPVPVEVSRLDKGLAPKPISPPDETRFCIEQTRSGAPIAHLVQHRFSTSRAAIAVEICRSTTRKDYAVTKASVGRYKDGRPMDFQTRVEILVSNLLLFLNELSTLDRLDRIERVLELLWMANEESPATGLASLAAMTDPYLAGALWNKCRDLIERRGFPNNDALLAAVAIYHASGRRVPVTGRNSAWPVFRILVAPSNVIKGSLCRLFQVVGPDANSIHQALLLDLLKKNPPNPAELVQIVIMLEELARALRHLQSRPELTKGVSVEPGQDADVMLHMVAKLRQLAEEYAETTDMTPDPHRGLRMLAELCSEHEKANLRLGSLISEIYSVLFLGQRSIQATYRDAFCRILAPKSPPGLWLDRPMRDLASNWPQIILSKKNEDISDKWKRGAIIPLIRFTPHAVGTKATTVYVDALVDKCIMEALSNVMHRTEQITCPWPNSDPTSLSDGWVRTVQAEGAQRVILELVNAAPPESQRQQETLASVHLRNIGGSLDANFDPATNRYSVRIAVPTVAALMSEVMS
jgi:hypothetical protein